MRTIDVMWRTKREYKTKNSRTLSTAYRKYYRQFPNTEEGLEAAKKLAKQKSDKGYYCVLLT